jgi:hypothetical protein
MRLWQMALAGFVAVPVLSWWVEALELHIRVRRRRKAGES